MAELYLLNGATAQADGMLKDAKAQLQRLRKTPARLRLLERIAALERRSALANEPQNSIDGD
jgi:thioredoxin-like negative regulator of GroEL